MDQNESVEIYMRFLNERHNILKTKIKKTIEILSYENKEQKINENTKLLDAARNLSKALSRVDTPDWLDSIIRKSKWYSESSGRDDANFLLLSTLIEQRTAALTHTWSVREDESEGAIFNFDEIYEKFKKDSKLPNLFDELISTIEKMIDSGEIDSINAINNLQQLLSLVKQNKSGSYFSLMASWEFIGSFTKNLIWEGISNLPVIKPLLKTLEKTLSDMDIELTDMHNKIVKEMRNKYDTTVHSLTYKRKKNMLLEHKTDDSKIEHGTTP